MAEVFIKTVRSNGRSLYARGQLARVYEIGKRYQFHPDLPAHVGRPLDWFYSLQDAYNNRAEPNAGNRLLLCLGEIDVRQVPVLDTYGKRWKKEFFTDEEFVTCLMTCTDFEVIGEIFLPQDRRWEENMDPNEDPTVYQIDAEISNQPVQEKGT